MTKLTKLKALRFLGIFLICLGIELAGAEGPFIVNFVGISFAVAGVIILR